MVWFYTRNGIAFYFRSLERIRIGILAI
jgi:hypothetical protein